METGVHAGLTPAEGRRFGFTVGGAFVVLAGIAYWRGHTLSPTILGSLAGILLVGGLVVPGRLGGIYRAWMGLAAVLSKVTTPIFLGIVFFLVLTPLGLIRRLVGQGHFGNRLTNGGYWARRADVRPPAHMERQF